jgi:hypothetical protein
LLHTGLQVLEQAQRLRPAAKERGCQPQSKVFALQVGERRKALPKHSVLHINPIE